MAHRHQQDPATEVVSIPPLRIARANALAKYLVRLADAGPHYVRHLDSWFDWKIELREQTINDGADLGLFELNPTAFDVEVRLIDDQAAAA